jgi:hypothetical protein
MNPAPWVLLVLRGRVLHQLVPGSHVIAAAAAAQDLSSHVPQVGQVHEHLLCCIDLLMIHV